MLNPINSILHSTKPNKDKLNILTACTHESIETELSKTNHAFYAYQHEYFKTWNDKYRKRPSNYELLSGGPEQIPSWIKFDLVLSQNKFGQFQVLAPIAKALQIPLISLEHTLPMKEWDEQRLESCANMRGLINVFISEYSIGQWGWVNHNDTVVIHHGIDTDMFKPSTKERNNHCLSVVNDWINRDWCCGFNIWARTIKGLPAKVLGDTPGLSKPASSLDDLVNHYQTSRIFYNTSTVSPIPTSLLESMSCLHPEQEVMFNFEPIPISQLEYLHSFNQKTRNDIILKKFINDYKGNILHIKPRMCLPIKVTEEHPIAYINITNKYDKSLRKLKKKPYIKIMSEIKYKPAKDLNENDYLVIPKIKIEKPIGFDKETLWVYGLFLAEGTCSHGSIEFTLHIDETEYIEKIRNFAKKFNRDIKIRKLKNEKAVKVSFIHSILANELEKMFSHLAHFKKIPSEIMLATKEEIGWFLDGYTDGDGCYRPGYIQYNTVSKTLAIQLQQLYIKLNKLPCLSYGQKPKRGYIRGREFFGKQQYSLSIYETHDKSKKIYLEDENNFYVRCEIIKTEEYQGKVYNLSTESNTFTCPSILVHNCGCAPVSTATCMIPEIIKNGYNGFISNDEKELRHYLELLLKDKELAEEIGKNARQTIVDNFSSQVFVNNWNKVFYKCLQLT